MEEADHVDSEQKYVRQMGELSGKEEHDLPLNQAIFASTCNVTSRDRDIESLPWNKQPRMGK